MPFAERDMFRHPLSDDELETLVSRVSAASLFSFRSPSVKSLGLNPDAMAEAEMLHWMGREPRLIRRPLLVTPERIVIGFDPEALRAALDAGA